MIATSPAKRVEILVDEPLVPSIAAAIREAGIGGHSIVACSAGDGRGGPWNREQRLTGADAKVFVIAIAAPDAAATLVDALAPLLDSHRLLLTIADVAVVRPARFAR